MADNNQNFMRMWSELETNIVIGEVSERDKNLFFGPVYDFDVFHIEDDDSRYPQLLKNHGFFQSTGEARRNGWDKNIPEGWSEHTIGKKKRKVYILKNTTGW